MWRLQGLYWYWAWSPFMVWIARYMQEISRIPRSPCVYTALCLWLAWLLWMSDSRWMNEWSRTCQRMLIFLNACGWFPEWKFTCRGSWNISSADSSCVGAKIKREIRNRNTEITGPCLSLLKFRCSTGRETGRGWGWGELKREDFQWKGEDSRSKVETKELRKNQSRIRKESTRN